MLDVAGLYSPATTFKFEHKLEKLRGRRKNGRQGSHRKNLAFFRWDNPLEKAEGFHGLIHKHMGPFLSKFPEKYFYI